MSSTEQHTQAPAAVDEAQAERLHAYAHSLRNKLAGLYEALRLSQTEADAKAREELATFGEIQFFHAMRETERLLDDLGVDRSVKELKRVTLDLKKLAIDALSHTEYRFTKKAQHVASDLADGMLTEGDAYFLETAIMALLSNASKFAQPGGNIRFTLARDGNSAVMQVQDDGVGLDEEDVRDVFRRYVWLRSRSTAGEAQGRSTLSRVKQWIELHGGTLTAASPGVDQGATFTLRLPLAG